MVRGGAGEFWIDTAFQILGGSRFAPSVGFLYGTKECVLLSSHIINGSS